MIQTASVEDARPLPLGPHSAWLERFSRVAGLAFDGLEDAGPVLVLALVGAHILDPALVALGEHGADFVHTSSSYPGHGSAARSESIRLVTVERF